MGAASLFGCWVSEALGGLAVAGTPWKAANNAAILHVGRYWTCLCMRAGVSMQTRYGGDHDLYMFSGILLCCGSGTAPFMDEMWGAESD